MRALLTISTRLRALHVFTLTNKRLKCLFCLFFCCYGLRFKNPRKATGPDCIPLKVIKFASNVIDSHLYNIIIKELEKKQVLRRAKSSMSMTHFQGT